jgi:hypothetical protein
LKFITYSGAQAGACLGQPGASEELLASSLCETLQMQELIETASSQVQRAIEERKAEQPKVVVERIANRGGWRLKISYLFGMALS